MGFGGAIKTCFSKYVTFSGRARRSEFWWFVLFLVIAGIIMRVLDMVLGTRIDMGQGPGPGILSSIWSLFTLLPSISVAVRRLHDRDRAGWWWWLWIIPLVGWIWLIVWYCMRGTAGENRFGPNPLAMDTQPGAQPA
jgi:uncharacterized membrane protein YhaH (DUF805 family)